MATPLPSLFWTALDTPLGTMILAARGRDELAALAGAWFVGQRHFDGPQADWQRDDDHPLLREAATQLHDWHAGRRIDFDLPLAPEGSAFQQSIWQALSRIPHGRTCSYGDLAAAVGRPGAARAVGAATGRNPLSILVPCHRLVGRDGALTGYAGGLERKRQLLAFEAATGR
ncbi:MAG: methylated-DNA--[protein]-cysteine S-methyltransferase [Sphaerotilus natans subsp. sulfidivorans]|uniref:methylated-DNA--[protein]-cysteine S-methyltransferase n=1 Tax=Sphaerotilus sulfidivorans TaxID=639200 RepID=UPI0023556300|nr:methylated-DNA--[protein]-cysteine S-methyltransferase [Sphaerotilus sulfidivorans]MCK6402414.1 methylated-DNA--[protein]-cysteine S-methyltransferase [Sphaerotilus sulfidivorans]